MKHMPAVTSEKCWQSGNTPTSCGQRVSNEPCIIGRATKCHLVVVWDLNSTEMHVVIRPG